MKVFTAALLVLTALLLQLTFAPAAAHAAEYYGYAYVDEGVTAYFCSEPDARKSLFAVPETYCVRILSAYDDEWYYVKYAEDDGVYTAVYGYVKKSALTVTTEPFESEYLYLTVRLKFSPDKVDGMTSLPDVEAIAAFYGSFEIGGIACSYMYCNGSFGYYPETYDYARNALPTAPAFNETQESDDGKIVTAVVIVLIAVAAVGAVYFTGRRKRPSETTPENDS